MRSEKKEETSPLKMELQLFATYADLAGTLSVSSLSRKKTEWDAETKSGRDDVTVKHRWT